MVSKSLRIAPAFPARRSGVATLLLTAVLFLATGVSARAAGRDDAAAAPEAAAGSGSATGDVEKRLEALEREIAALKADLARGGGAGSADLERRIDALSKEIERMRLGEAASPEAGESAFGFGPAASKVYRARRGVSIGGYGEMLYTNPDDTADDGSASGEVATADLLRAVLYFGYKWNDHLLFNSEIEFEHAVAAADTGGEVAVEFAYVDYRRSDRFGARGGLLLIPVGFLNELHEPPIFFGSTRPEVEQAIIPSTWRELGGGIYGSAGPIAWKAYLVTSLNAAGFTADEGIREGRQEGSEVVAEDLAVTARVDWTVRPGLLLGAAGFTGQTAQDNAGVDGARVLQYEAHAEWRWKAFQVRGLYARTRLDDAAEVGVLTSEAVGSQMNGYYGEVAYNVLSLKKGSKQELFPFVRYESLDTQAEVPAGTLADPANDRTVHTVGIHYRPIPNLALKADWQGFSNNAGTGVDRINLALGWLF
ncbi:MAG TPA: hypothetical protein VGS03_00685 [Candidatus Polarisedimenticolia bacterium]|jgi:hypothetical protein|nr:hypothetical protein [Candidatus Polarisedimenticolia bacterium]